MISFILSVFGSLLMFYSVKKENLFLFSVGFCLVLPGILTLCAPSLLGTVIAVALCNVFEVFSRLKKIIY